MNAKRSARNFAGNQTLLAVSLGKEPGGISYIILYSVCECVARPGIGFGISCRVEWMAGDDFKLLLVAVETRDGWREKRVKRWGYDNVSKEKEEG